MLFLPKAFQHGGALFSSLVLTGMAALSVFCTVLLIACRQVMGPEVPGSYTDIGLAAGGPWGRFGVELALVGSQIGFCCVYLGFVARNVLQLLNVPRCWVGEEWMPLLLVSQALVLVPLSWVTNMSSFAVTNLLGDLVIAACIAAVLGWAGVGVAAHPGGVPPGGGVTSVPLFNPADWPLFIGTAVYAFEGVGVMLPLFNSLPPASRASFPRVMYATLGGVSLTYLAMGLLPFLYLDGVLGAPMADVITLDLPRAGWAWALQGGYCVALLCTYPLQLFPALGVIEERVGDKLQGQVWRTRGLRTAVVLATIAVSWVGSSQLNNLVSLVGAVACAPLAFIFPALFHLRLVPGISRCARGTDIAIIVFGVGVMLFSTYLAIATWGTSVVQPCIQSP